LEKFSFIDEGKIVIPIYVLKFTLSYDGLITFSSWIFVEIEVNPLERGEEAFTLAAEFFLF